MRPGEGARQRGWIAGPSCAMTSHKIAAMTREGVRAARHAGIPSQRVLD